MRRSVIAILLAVGLSSSTGCMSVAGTRTSPETPAASHASGFSWKKALLLGLILPVAASTSVAAGLD